ncbi:putative nucleotide-binding of sugar-metabolising enzyme domain-containing protein [Trichoderma breve]|uniref:Nucleotide-binding of sugar-metabolising enzyme domain-containing protein n=1 Tax=Trichoderma breve TaxID=2034170 RepID=A0A9W9E666_9HYPO|nr:putative nucleotide-binding of sugar-metabolising enzyme domain-containing protein [Trichoderma breve]KAJ4858037.1 putative nucleotide-binding of sugar-metabolising enzyme domain-containing protein [Trichoderma breve]
MDLPILSYQDTLERLPPPVLETDLAERINYQVQGRHLGTLVILDDDPTGTQTCHGIKVLTTWDLDILVDEFQSHPSGFFILTNSRALPSGEACALVRQICKSVQQAAYIAKKTFEIVLRGDSTLRGHFPSELDAVEDIIGKADLWIFAPFFSQGHRVTIDDVHYITDIQSDKLIPVARTPFAGDATFGYRNSNLKDYVLEKSGGQIATSAIFSISLQDLRLSGVSGVTQKLLSMPPRSVVIVNAVADADMGIFVQGLLGAKAVGRKCTYRTAASFVSTRLGIQPTPPIGIQQFPRDASSSSTGGLIFAGSYVPTTTRQLTSLIDGRGPLLATVTLDAEQLLADNERARHAILHAVRSVNHHIANGEDTLVMTSRKLIVGDDGHASLNIGGIIAEALVAVLSALETRPRYIIAKGGITSSDAATKGLRIRRAKILGQAAPGIPLWKCDEPGSKFPNLPFVVFPGNVGSDTTLRDLVADWAREL